MQPSPAALLLVYLSFVEVVIYEVQAQPCLYHLDGCLPLLFLFFLAHVLLVSRLVSVVDGDKVRIDAFP